MMKKVILPKKLRLESCTLCQLKCPSCTTASKEIGPVVGFGYLTYNNFKKIIDENPFIKEIEISNFGEIFLNPQFVKIVKYAHFKKVVLTAENGVNGNTVSDETLEALVKYKFYRISFSLDGASQETYAQYRRKGDFNKVIAAIKKLNEYKKSYRTSLPKLAWQFVVFGHNEQDITKAREMAIELDMEFRPKLSWDPDFSPIRNQELVKKATGLGAASRSEFKDKKLRNYAGRICHQLWDEPQINWDGKILGCCWNYWKAFEGNAFTDGLVKSLNLPAITHARNVLQGREPANEDLPCLTCDLYKEMKKDQTWLNRGVAHMLYLLAKKIDSRLNIRKLKNKLFH